MKNLLAFVSIFALLSAQASAKTQVGNWDAVESLSPGSNIRVNTESRLGTRECIFQSATDERLVCESLVQGPYQQGPMSYLLYRSTVHEVRLQHYTGGDNSAKGVGIGAGIGAALGAAIGGRNGSSRGDSALVGGFLFGVFGYVIGANSAAKHSRVVFRR
jgi:hypothetical protein